MFCFFLLFMFALLLYVFPLCNVQIKLNKNEILQSDTVRYLKMTTIEENHWLVLQI